MYMHYVQQLDLHNTETKYTLMMAVIDQAYYMLDTVTMLLGGLI